MDRFVRLLDRYNAAEAAPADRAALEKQLWQQFGRQGAVLIQDMSGFSLFTRRFGIVHYLAMVRRMQATTQPIVERQGGELVKFEADNLFAVFKSVAPAIEAARRINLEFGRLNLATEDARDIHVSSGIAYGEYLLVPGHDLFGDCVNLACKMGEDLAEKSEILIDARAHEQLGADPGFALEPARFTVSGLPLEAYRVKG
ncbi:MAG: adenylate/guanylate cyclase domain-containing protein [Alphaproteobacteria bacterium]|nr:adenylate/guanylate cyclase domain-containing protein [Alphaproteobacteria bacterium]